ncbi:MAG: hypothetical protein V1775_16035 [Bacteroidota bacterium]
MINLRIFEYLVFNEGKGSDDELEGLLSETGEICENPSRYLVVIKS